MTTRATRREFLKRASLLSAAGGVGAPFALNLAAIGAAAAQTGDYKALVCLFMRGGNDHVNTVVPYDTANYNAYVAARSSVAHAHGTLGGTTLGAVSSQGGRQFALHPALTSVKGLWDQGKAAIVANVGPLLAPTTAAQYRNNAVPLPPKLFSHNDQTSVWQAYTAMGEGAAFGWGGRIGDLLASQNGSSAFTCVSADGTTVWLAGTNVLQYQVGPNGPASIVGLNEEMFSGANARSAYRGLLTRSSSQLMENEVSVINNRALISGDQLRGALPPASSFPGLPDRNNLAKQMQIVARTIGARNALGMRRQVFFVSLGTFDHHDDLVRGHAGMLEQVNAAVGAFWFWIAQMGLENNVTLFTASEFGRTLASNGDGTDHGWGSHHFVIGGGVRGKNIYGTYPPMAMEHEQAASRGVLVPTTSVDQYGATFARWLGVSDTNVPLVLPNIGRFGTSRYLGFMG